VTSPPPDLVAHVIPLAKPMPSVFGVGAYLKSCVCFIQGSEAWISHDIGLLDNVEAIARFHKTAEAIIMAGSEPPEIVAHDWHPDFYSSRWARESGLRRIGVQHHHAHIAAVMAEHGIERPTLGLALDGFGLGDDDQSWGGELLQVERFGFERLGHLFTLPQPGGDVAARQPWRMGAAALWSMGRGDEIAERYAAHNGASMLAFMMERQLNAPLTSSAGRLFDAACGLLGVVLESSFDGEAPMKLESLVTEPRVDPEGWSIDGMVLDLRPLMGRLAGMEAVDGANLFHGTLVAAVLDWTERAVENTGIKQIAMAGGCFFNKFLREGLVRGMMDKGLTPLLPKQLLVGDTAIALGQAYAAAMGLSVGGKG